MYLYRWDEENALACWALDQIAPSDWDAHFAHMALLPRLSKQTGKRPAAILISRDLSRPDAHRRAELVRLTEAPGYDPFVAFVTPSVALRAMLTMFGWVQKTPLYEMNFFGTSLESIPWLEKKRGTRLDLLRKMLDEVKADYKKQTGRDLP